jgi:hypothetical protein
VVTSVRVELILQNETAFLVASVKGSKERIHALLIDRTDGARPGKHDQSMAEIRLSIAASGALLRVAR